MAGRGHSCKGKGRARRGGHSDGKRCGKGSTGSCHRTGQSHSSSHSPTYAGGSDKQQSPNTLCLLKSLLLVVNHFQYFFCYLMSLSQKVKWLEGNNLSEMQWMKPSRTKPTCVLTYHTYTHTPEKPRPLTITHHCTLIVSLCVTSMSSFNN